MSQRGCPVHGLSYLKVIQRKCNHSAFNGYRYTASDYSDVRCFAPGGCAAHTRYRTKARYVDDLPDATDVDLGIAR